MAVIQKCALTSTVVRAIKSRVVHESGRVGSSKMDLWTTLIKSNYCCTCSTGCTHSGRLTGSTRKSTHYSFCNVLPLRWKILQLRASISWGMTVLQQHDVEAFTQVVSKLSCVVFATLERLKLWTIEFVRYFHWITRKILLSMITSLLTLAHLHLHHNHCQLAVLARKCDGRSEMFLRVIPKP